LNWKDNLYQNYSHHLVGITICKIVIPANQAVADLYNMDNNCRLFISVFVFTKIINCDLGVIL